jgi:hypothetical protein
MSLVWNPMVVENTILCLVILTLGYWGYRKRKSSLALYIGIAFGFFAVSHILALVGFATELENVLLVIRIIAYLLIIFALYRVLVKSG